MPTQPIAIVGIGCRFPGHLNTPSALWRALCTGLDAIEPVTTRFAQATGRQATLHGGFIDGVDRWDAGFFRLSPREAASLDPQHRLVLEVGMEALEDAGMPTDSLRGPHTAVFIGMHSGAAVQGNDVTAMVGAARSGAAGRLSYALGAQGPSFSIDADRASSLVAVHAACASLRRGEARVALAGGVNILTTLDASVAFSRAGMLAPDGRCKFADARADGFVRSEGVGMVVLKPLQQALSDGDTVYAVIRGSAVRHVGDASGDLMSPSSAAQQEVVRAACADAEVAPHTLDCIEAHGTGTPRGDAAELQALAAVLAHAPRQEPCWVGSIKTNIGHTEAAAGVAGLIKACLMLQHRQVAPSLHLRSPHADVAWTDLQVPTTLQPWPRTDHAPRMGVSAYGLTGAAAHVVLEAAPAPLVHAVPTVPGLQLLPLSAHDPQALADLAQLAQHAVGALPDDAALGVLCRGHGRQRAHSPHRLAALGTTRQDMVAALDAFINDGKHGGLVRQRAQQAPTAAPLFVYAGFGWAWSGMGMDLMAQEPAFRHAMHACDAAIAAVTGWSVLDVLRSATDWQRQDVAQPTMFAVQVALTALWRSWGVHPAAVVGHSMGEVAAAHACGALSLTDAVQVICLRSSLMMRGAGRGAMMVVQLSPDETAAALAPMAQQVCVAAYNSPAACTVSGDSDAVQRLKAQLQERGVECTLVKLDIASHSPHMDAPAAALQEALPNLRPQAAQVPWYSTVTGTADADAAYWARNLRAPVRFAQAAQRAMQDGHRVCLEISGHGQLLGALTDSLQHVQSRGVTLGSLRRQEPGRANLLKALAGLYVAGVPVDWQRVYPGGGRVALPLYPWQRQAMASHNATPAPDTEPPSAPVTAAAAPPAVTKKPAPPGAKHIRSIVAAVLGQRNVSNLDTQRPLRELGLTSVLAVELRNALSEALDTPLPSTLLFNHPTLAALVQHLTGEAPQTPAALPTAGSQDIAIIGMACRFPGGADSPEAYGQLLRDGIDAICEVPQGRWSTDAHNTTPRLGGFLRHDIAAFDHAFFNIGRREAERLDPQQRLLMEVSWEALERAGQTLEHLRGSAMGVFIGAMNYNEYAQLKDLAHAPEDITAYDSIGDANSVAAGRLAYVYGVHGPCMTIDTACSSSLVALHVAVQSLRRGECSMALVGGVNLMLRPETTLTFGKSGMMAPDGRCKTFDAAANGYVRAEGCGMLVIKPLEAAQRDGDTVLAVVRGSAVNQDGRSNGLTAPNGQAQEMLLRAALHDARIMPAEVGYVEAHGTGTALGDPIEMQALDNVLGQGRTDPLRVGSVKTNIGHLEAAAGMAGLMKGVLALQQHAVFAHLHFKTLNPHITVTPDRVQVAGTITEPWATTGLRVAGVSAFGFSGTNAHVVLSEAPPSHHETVDRGEAAEILTLSARHPEALKQTASRLMRWLQETPAPMGDIASTAQLRRSHHSHRAAVVGHTRAEWMAGLQALSQQATHATLCTGDAPDTPPPLVLVFSGQGSQWLGMGRTLLSDEPVFAQALRACDAALQPHTGWSVLEELQATPTASKLDRVEVIQPTLFAMQVALAALWRSWGVHPTAVVGHSMGEVAAAHVAGALTLADAARVIALRSQLMMQVAGRGAMLVVDVNAEAAHKLTSMAPNALWVAVHNGPRSTGIAGEVAAVHTLHAQLQARGAFSALVKTDVAFHSPHMDGLTAALEAGLQGMAPREPQVPLVSTVTGDLMEKGEPGPHYWRLNLRQPVLFDRAMQTLLAEAPNVLEISPHPVLLAGMAPQVTASGRAAVGSTRRQEPERRGLLHSLAALHVHGQAVDFAPLHRGPKRIVALPPYPWQKERCWLDTPAPRAAPVPRSGEHPLLGAALAVSTQPQTRLWEAHLSTSTLPYLADHRVGDAVVVPGAAYVEMMWAAARAVDASAFLYGMRFVAMLLLPDQGAVHVQTSAELSGTSSGQLHIRSLQNGHWVTHASGSFRASAPATPVPALPDDEAPTSVQADALYADLAACDLHYGPAFRGLTHMRRSAPSATGNLQAPPQDTTYTFHPTVLDAALQVAVLHAQQHATRPGAWLPVGVGQLQLHGDVRAAAQARAHVSERDSRDTPEWRGHVQLLDAAGHVLAHLANVQLRALPRATPQAISQQAPWLRHTWQALPPLPAPAPAAGAPSSWLLMGNDRSGLAQALRKALTGHGATVVHVLRDEDLAKAMPSALTTNNRPWHGVVHLQSLQAPPLLQAESIYEAQAHGYHSAMHLLQTLTKQRWRDPPRVWLVTRGAQQPTGRGDVAVAQAPLWGLGRTVAYEHPELRCTRLDLDWNDYALDLDMAAESLARELLANSAEDELALRPDGARYSGRLLQPAALPTPPPQQTPAGTRSFGVDIQTPGILDTVMQVPQPRRAPEAHEVEIAVQAAGINFLDVLWALGVMPRDWGGAAMPLGSECAGTVVAVGSAVQGLTLGQSVVTWAPGGMGTHITVPMEFVHAHNLAAEDAATLPLAHLTAYYALAHVARLKAGERILIHSAAGGVGLAAVQWAQHVGAEIFATVGTQEKRDALRAMGVQHVSDSHSLSFVDDVQAWTGGEGVDVVLNALAGDAIAQSIDLLRDYGRFVEIGKRDYMANTALGMQPFLRNLSFALVDLLGMQRKRPQLAKQLFAEVMALVQRGVLRPLPKQVLPVAQAQQAFRTMAAGKHVGKLVLSMHDAANTPLTTQPGAVSWRRDATYLITGGLGGLGLALAQWMVQQGAGHVVLTSRHGVQTAAQQAAIDALQPHVHVFPADVSQQDSVQHLLQQLRALPTLRGVVHAAAVLDDAMLADQTPQRLRTVLDPKALGAWHLHSLTKQLPLDFFVMYSSVTALLGSPGQANYTASNAFMDALAVHRQHHGLPAVSIQWGPFADVGMAAAQAQRGERLAQRGMHSLTPAQAHTWLSQLLQAGVATLGAAPFDARQWLEYYPHLARGSFFADLSRQVTAPPSPRADMRSKLQQAPPGERVAMLERFLRAQLAAVLHCDPARITADARLKELGVESLVGLELRNQLEATLGLQLPATLTWAHPSLAALVRFFTQELQLVAPEPAVAPAPPPAEDPEAAAVAALSRDALFALIEREL